MVARPDRRPVLDGRAISRRNPVAVLADLLDMSRRRVNLRASSFDECATSRAPEMH